MCDGYTHGPDAFDDGERGDTDVDAAGPVAADAHGRQGRPGSAAAHDRDDDPAARRTPAERTFDWRGWVLVAAIAVCFLLVPGVILAYPHVGHRLGLSFYHTYLALPMIPAVVLAILAVWATARP
jgi:hypothetical protein